jgi:hypothetical protein
MRVLLPLSIALLAAGCRGASPDSEGAAYQVPNRDLTLRPPTESASPEVASPVELVRAPAQRRAERHTRQPRQAVTVLHAMTVSTVERAPAAAPSLPPAVSAETEAPDPHALAPGQTVTVLPSSTASADTPASSGDWTDALPADGRGTTIRGGGGGDCGGRGHGGRPGGGGGFRGLR